jgi:NO-binding membrane sensor protein with MHYT domain
LHAHHFAYGPLTPALAYSMSFIGSLLGLQCTSRARAVRETGRRVWWLAGGALAIGGAGIWVMHFIAMLGFGIPGAPINYDVPLTLFSALLAVLVVGIGLVFVGFSPGGWRPVLLGGVFTGGGVAVMHYTGMAAMHAGATLSYDRGLIALSLLIAIVAATAALWFPLRVRGLPAMVGAALVMGVAVTGMHYTGMAALRVGTAMTPRPGGVAAEYLIVPLIIGVSLVTALLLVLVGGSASEAERLEEAGFEDRVQRLLSG